MSRLSPSRLLAILLLLTTGCGVHVATAKRAADAAPRESCENVQLLQGGAPRDWKVVAVIELESFSVRALPRDDAAFLELVRSAVCEAGGDAVIPGVNTDGRYVLGTVVAWTGPAAAPCAEDDRC